MLHKTQGIVINYIKYKESSIITKIFTEAFGLQTYIVNSVRSKKSKNKISLFQPLTILDLVIYKNGKNNIQRISEYKNQIPYREIPFDPKKSMIGMFMSELLSKIVSEEENQSQLFTFLSTSFDYLDKCDDKNFSNFTVLFLSNLSFNLGFYADSTEIIEQTQNHITYTPQENIVCMEGLKKIENVRLTQEINLNNQERKLAFNVWMKFFQINLPSVQNIKSVDIIREINM